MDKTKIFMESIGQLGLTKSQFNAVKSLYEAINDDTLTVDSKYEPLLAKYGIDKIVNLLKEHNYDIHYFDVSEEKVYTYYTLYKVFIQGQERGENTYTGRCIEVSIDLFPNSNDQFNGTLLLIDDDTLYVCQDGTTSDSRKPDNCKYKTADDMYMALENFFTQDAKREPKIDPWTEEQKQAALRDWGDLQLRNDIRNMFND
jgi:hypothetical protein